VSGSYDNKVILWDWRSKTPIKINERHTKSVQCVAFSPDGRYFASGSYDKRVLLWDGKTGDFVKEIDVLRGTVKDVKFSPDGKKLFASQSDENIYAIPSGEKIFTVRGHRYANRGAFYGRTGKYIAVGGSTNNNIVIVNTETGKTIAKIQSKGKPRRNVGFGNKLNIAFGSRYKKGGNSNGPLEMSFDFAKLKLNSHDIDPENFTKVYLERNGFSLKKLSGYRLKWGSKEKNVIKNSSSGDGWIYSYTYTPDKNYIVLGNGFGINLHHYKGKKQRALVGHTSSVVGVSVSSDNNYLVTASLDQTIRIWDLKDPGKATRTYNFKPVNQVYTHPSWAKVWPKIGAADLVTQSGKDAWLAVIKKLRQNGKRIDAALLTSYMNRKLKYVVRPLATLFVATDNEWVCWTPQGYYAASAGGERYIGWHINRGSSKLGTYYPVATFRKKYYKPDLVKLIIKHRSFDKAMQEYNSKNVQVTENIVKKNENIMDHLPPKIEWVNPAEGDLKVQGKEFTVKAHITSGTKITGVKLLVNGRAVAKTRGFEVVKNKSDKEKVLEYKVTLESPETNLLVFASNTSSSTLSEGRTLKREAGNNSNRGNDDLEFDVKQNSMLKPNLYVVSVGVSNFKKKSYNLDYAHADAESMSALFKTQKGLLYKDVQVKELTNEQATRANILDAFYWLEKNVTHKDVAILFIASHGFNEKGKFYILPHDGDPERLRSTAVNWADFQDVLGNLPSKVMLFLDACHSGALGENLAKTRGAKVNNTEAIREITSAEHGVVVMSASTGNESSLERPDWKHGAFTYALLKAMKQKKADFNNDGIVYLRELDFFVADEVKNLTKGKQHPTTLKPSTISRMPLIQVRK
jgi:WD40 repeat protein